jgi:hypothetical protein
MISSFSGGFTGMNGHYSTGTYTVLSGTVTVDGVAAERKIMVLDRYTLDLLAATHSNADTGEWTIKGIADAGSKRILVLALDTTGNYNAEVADYVTQVTVSVS